MRKAWEQAKKWTTDPRISEHNDGSGDQYLTDDSFMQDKFKTKLRRSNMKINENEVSEIFFFNLHISIGLNWFLNSLLLV